MTTLIFGGLGHVGSWIAHDILERGEDVAIFDLGAARLDPVAHEHLQRFADRIHLESVDVLDSHTLYQRMRSYETTATAVVFGIAAVAGPAFNCQPIRNIQINTMGFLNVLEVARVLGIPKFVNLSSGAVYGAYRGSPDENVPFSASDLYASTKIANEIFAQQFSATYGMDIRTARLFAVYGPGRLPSRLHPFYKALFGPLEGLTDISVPHGGDQAMDWTHVRDTAAGVVALLYAESLSNRVFNISSGIAVPHAQIVARVRDMVGFDTKVSMGPGSFIDRGTPLDVTAATRELRYVPRFADINVGLLDYRDWLLKIAPVAGISI